MRAGCKIMFILYDLIFFIFALLYLPLYLLKGKFHKGFARRFGFIPKGLVFEDPIWIHAVSVGEVMAMRELIKKLRLAYPRKRLVISTVTPTGNKIARTLEKEGDFVTYLPVDLSFILRKVIKRVKPSLFIIAETEIWPNLITCLHEEGVPIAIFNSRISDASFKGYKNVRYLLRPILNKVDIYCAQSESDKSKLSALGVNPDKIIVTGNMKFDQVSENMGDPAVYRRKIGLKPDDKLVIAGSTHRGEEEVILSVYRLLLKDFPGLRLLIAPRHPERADEVESLAKNSGFDTVKASSIKEGVSSGDKIIILDTVGELALLYNAADIVFMGGSLVKKGGQNILEPAGAGKPVIFGQYMFNFKDISRSFLDNKAALMVSGQDGLAAAIRNLLNNKEEIYALTSRARSLISNNRGATGRNITLIKHFIERTT